MIKLDPDQVEAARNGSRVALDAIVRAARRPIYNLALRMLANRTDAEDATQEILIKIVTHLGSMREAEAAGAWALRVACRHLAQERKRGRIEAMRLTFAGFAADLEQGLAPLPEGEMTDVEATIAIEEIKIGCTLAMLVCLTRELRIAYLLGEVFELTHVEAADVLEITPAAYRQRLRRARAAVTHFVGASCGIVSAEAVCRCDRRVAPALRCGRIAKGRSDFGLDSQNRSDLTALRARVGQLEQDRAAAALMRSNPDFTTKVGDLVVKHLSLELPST
jgi:RNA polymerase sigma factor (sigma-70 family)